MKALEQALEVEAAHMALESASALEADSFKARFQACALELFRTEASYLAKLRTVHFEFHRRLRAQLTFDELEFPDRAEANYYLMFEYAHGLIECHEELLKELKTAARELRLLRSLDEIFFKFIGRSRDRYIEFALSYPDITGLLSKHQQNHRRFNEFVFVSEMCAGESINSLRIASIQRSRYKLLLTELLQFCEHSSTEATTIQVAINEFQEFTSEIDNCVSQGERIAQVRSVQDGFFEGNINLMDCRRKLIKSAEMTKLFNRQKAHMTRGKRHKVYLFSDCLLYSEFEGRHRCKHVIHLSQMKIVNSDKETNAIKIISSIKSVILLPDSHEDKIEWLNLLQAAILACNPLPPLTSARNFEAYIKSPNKSTIKKDRGYSRSFSMTLLNSDSSQLRRRSSLPSIWLTPGRLRSLATAVFGNAVTLKPTFTNLVPNEA